MKRVRAAISSSPSEIVSTAQVSLVDDVWSVILFHSIRAPWNSAIPITHTPLICSLGLVCKQWHLYLMQAITAAFTTLRMHSLKVDSDCRMISPYQMWELKNEMKAFCCSLKMKPADILMVVDPTWATIPLTAEETHGYAPSQTFMYNIIGGIRTHRHSLGSVLIRCEKRWHKNAMGPWSFDGTWDAYLLAMFLRCCSDQDNRSSLELLALPRCERLWNYSFIDTLGIGNQYPVACYRLIQMYYISDFPFYFTKIPRDLDDETAPALSCCHPVIDAVTFYSLFPSVYDWLVFLRGREFFNDESLMDFVKDLSFSTPVIRPVDLAVNWGRLFIDPAVFTDQQQLITAYQHLTSEPSLQLILEASDGLRGAYMKAISAIDIANSIVAKYTYC